MKRLLSLLCFTALLIAAPLNGYSKTPKIYPSILGYFASLNTDQRKNANLSALETLKYHLKIAAATVGSDSIVLACSGNSFRSQALQVFFQTMLSASQNKKMVMYSCGYKAIAIDERLITYLKKIGYKISEKQYAGQLAYEVRFSDMYPSLLLYPKTCTDSILPKKEFISVLACEESAGVCEQIPGTQIKINLKYRDRNDLKNAEEYEKEVKQIATDVYYVFKSKQR